LIPLHVGNAQTPFESLLPHSTTGSKYQINCEPSPMAEAAQWTVRELRVYLHSHGISTSGMKEKSELIGLATDLLLQQQRAKWAKYGTAAALFVATAISFNVYLRPFVAPKIERVLWTNPKWAASWFLLHFLTVLEKLLGINVILSWIVPSTLSEYNVLDKYLVKKLQIFPLYVPLNFDSQTGNASMWINLYPMLLMWIIRRIKGVLTRKYHYFQYERYRDGYYTANPRAQRTRPVIGDRDGLRNEDEYHHDDHPADSDFESDLQRAIMASLEENNQ